MRPSISNFFIVNRKKLSVFLACWLLSLGIWFLNAMGKRYEHVIRLETTFLNLPGEKELYPNLPSHLDVQVFGQGWDLFKLYFGLADNHLFIDYDRIGQRKMLYTLQISNYIASQLSSRLSVVKIFPEVISLEADQLQTKTVAVKIDWEKKLKPGFELLAEPVAVPDSIQVLLPDSMMDKVNFIETRKIMFDDPLEKNTEKKAELKRLDNLKVYSKQRMVDVFFTVDRMIQTEQLADIVVVNAPMNKQIRPIPSIITVRLSMPMQKFRQFKNWKPRVIVDFSKKKPGDSYLYPSIENCPPEIKKVSFVPERIDFIQRTKQ